MKFALLRSWATKKGIPLLLFSLLLLVGVPLSGCIAPSVGWSGGSVSGDTLYVGSLKGGVVALEASRGEKLWSLPLEGLRSQSAGGACLGPVGAAPLTYSTPYLEGDRMYVAGYGGLLYGVSASTRSIIWKYPRDGKVGAIVGSPIVSRGTVFIGSSDKNIYALDAATGEFRWKFPTGDKVWSTGAAADDLVYFGSFDKKVYALRITTGSKEWEFETGGAIAAEPLVYEGTVYVGSFDKNLYAIDALNGREKWHISGQSWFWAKPVAHKGVIYAPSLDGKVYAIRAEDGEVQEIAVDSLSPISASPVVVDDFVVFGAENGGVYLIDTGNMGWRKLYHTGGEIKAPLFTAKGVVYIQTQDKNLHAVDAQTGNRLWVVPID